MVEVHPETPRTRGCDAPHGSLLTPAEDARTILINKVSWGALLAGVVVTLVIQLVLNMLGIGIGPAALDAGMGDYAPVSSFFLDAGLWFALTSILAAFAGGYAAGRLAGKPNALTAGWHGLTSWALTVVFYLLTSTAGDIPGRADRTMSTAGPTAQTGAPNLPRVTDPFSSIEPWLRGATGGNDSAAFRDAAVAAVRAAVAADLHEYHKRYGPQQATQAADTAADAAASRSPLFGAVGLLLGAVAGWFGGRMGAVEPRAHGAHRAEPEASGVPGGGRTATVVGGRFANHKRQPQPSQLSKQRAGPPIGSPRD